MNSQWSIGEERFIRENMNRMNDRELLEKLRLINPRHGRKISLDGVRKKRQRMKLIRKK